MTKNCLNVMRKIAADTKAAPYRLAAPTHQELVSAQKQVDARREKSGLPGLRNEFNDFGGPVARLKDRLERLPFRRLGEGIEYFGSPQRTFYSVYDYAGLDPANAAPVTPREASSYPRLMEIMKRNGTLYKY